LSLLESYCAGIRDTAADVALGREPYTRECPLCGNTLHRLDRGCRECDCAPEHYGPETREQRLAWIAAACGVLAMNPDAPEPAVTALRERIAEWRAGL
jgi:hypothetical protein